MHLDLSLRKYRLIEEIMLLDDEQALGELERRLREIHGKEAFRQAIRPIRPAATLQQLIDEQGYEPVSRERFYEQVRELQIEAPLEDLLNLLTA